MTYKRPKMTSPEIVHLQASMLLHILDYAVEDDVSEGVLAAISAAIRKAAAHIKDANQSGNLDYVDHVVDEECDMIEALLGTAFVVCQTYISAVIAAARRLAEHANSHSSTRLPTSALALMAKGEPFNTEFSKVAVLWELGNFFKHRDEWGYRWTKAKLRTAKAIKAAGLGPGSTGNLREGAKALGNPDFVNCGRFRDIAASWAKALQTEFRNELRI